MVVATNATTTSTIPSNHPRFVPTQIIIIIIIIIIIVGVPPHCNDGYFTTPDRIGITEQSIGITAHDWTDANGVVGFIRFPLALDRLQQQSFSASC